jgi:O-methyltransferase
VHDARPVDLYLDLLARTLTRAVFEDNDRILGIEPSWRPRKWWVRAADSLAPLLARLDLEVVKRRPFDAGTRAIGLDWPSRAETMVGLRRLENVRSCIESVLTDNVPGDLLEAGVWRGGTAIFMRGVLKAHGITDRTVWLADSFRGLPPPNLSKFPYDKGNDLTKHHVLSVGLEVVRHNFERYELLDDQVQFLEGWFKDTLPNAPIEQLAVLRLDGDMYESTIQTLEPLYPRLSVGGFCIVDDFATIPACRMAVNDYRAANGIEEQVVPIDGSAVYWRVQGH